MMVLLALVGFLVVANIALSWIARWRNPPIGKFIEVDGVRLHYIERGSDNRMPLVMLHGNGTALQDLTISGLVDCAAKRFRVICFDRPGFGFSSRPRFQIWNAERQAQILCAALTKLHINQCLVLGHSWGTLVALAMAARRSAQVKGLILVSGYYFPTARFDVWFASIAAIPIVGDLLRYTISPISTWFSLPIFAKKVFSPKSVPTTVKNEYPRLLLIRPGQLRAVAEDSALMVPSATTLSGSYRKLDCPTAIFAGQNDQIVESEQAARLQRTLPRATLRRLDGLGHMAHYFAVDEIIESADTVRTEASLFRHRKAG